MTLVSTARDEVLNDLIVSGSNERSKLKYLQKCGTKKRKKMWNCKMRCHITLEQIQQEQKTTWHRKKHLHLQSNLWGEGNKTWFIKLCPFYFPSYIKYHRKIQAIQILLFCYWFWMTCPVSDAMRKDSYLTKMCRFAWKTHAKPKLSNQPT